MKQLIFDEVIRNTKIVTFLGHPVLMQLKSQVSSLIRFKKFDLHVCIFTVWFRLKNYWTSQELPHELELQLYRLGIFTARRYASAQYCRRQGRN